MGTIENLTRAITSMQSQYEAKKDQNRQIQAKIDALENSKRLMSDALEKAESLRNGALKQKVDGWWNGTLSYEVTDHIATSGNRARDIVHGIKDGIGEINRHILKLRLEYDYIVGLMSNLEDSINEKMHERQRAIYEADTESNSKRS